MAGRETILVLEHDQVTVKRIADGASSCGFQISEFSNGADAVRSTVGLQMVAAFVDLKLANESQAEFFRQFSGAHPLVPIVVMSNVEETNGLQDFIRFGVTHFLVKPFSAAAIQAEISRTILEDDLWVEKAMTAISSRLRETRRRLGIKQKMIATLTGLTAARICQIERAGSTPSVESLVRICKALRTPISEIVSGI